MGFLSRKNRTVTMTDGRTRPSAEKAPLPAPRLPGQARTRPAYDPAEVAKVAYELFLQRGGAHGSDVDDWLKAEQIVLARRRAFLRQ